MHDLAVKLLSGPVSLLCTVWQSCEGKKKRVPSNHFSHGHDRGRDHGQVDGHGVGPKFGSKNLDRKFGTEFLGSKLGVGPEQVLLILGRLESGMTIWIIII